MNGLNEIQYRKWKRIFNEMETKKTNFFSHWNLYFQSFAAPSNAKQLDGAVSWIWIGGSLIFFPVRNWSTDRPIDLLRMKTRFFCLFIVLWQIDDSNKWNIHKMNVYKWILQYFISWIKLIYIDENVLLRKESNKIVLWMRRQKEKLLFEWVIF